ncbi:MAG: divergent polysaccharide deacetylase family protein, partial [Candidatus Omnitrophica bacterium]|nr:divergent polysaccharide deacetylase family protein [Candidatus Omnitrophota bacterium]
SLLKESRELEKVGRYRFEKASKTYAIRSDFPIDAFLKELQNQLRVKKLRIVSWSKNIKERTYQIDSGFKTIKLFTLNLRSIKKEVKPPPVFKKGKVAIVIDDFGYNLNEIDAWVKFAKPITFSILPNLSYSSRIDNLAATNGKEVILHLPMEPQEQEKQPQESFTITDRMARKDMLNILNKDIISLPHVKGASNHQGSKSTEDTSLMHNIFAELKKRNFFFLDSLVTNKSVCYDLASKMGIKFAQRDIFLDNINEVDRIVTQLDKLADLAQEKGYAIGVGHNRPKTLLALKEAVVLLESRGIEFVYLSELVK